MKKLSIIFIFLLLFINFIFAQEDSFLIEINTWTSEEYGIYTEVESPLKEINKWISGEISLLGFGIRYERTLNSYFSTGINIHANFTGVLHIGGTGNIRYYPFERNFFLGLGLGYQFTRIFLFGAGGLGFAVNPEIGWKIDVGKPGGFFLQPGIKLPITIIHRELIPKGWIRYDQKIIVIPEIDDLRGGDYLYFLIFYLGIGYAY